MKLQLSLSVVFFAAPCVSAFQNHRNRMHKVSSVERRSTAKDIETVTKEDLLGARDEIDKLLREKACGTSGHKLVQNCSTDSFGLSHSYFPPQKIRNLH